MATKKYGFTFIKKHLHNLNTTNVLPSPSKIATGIDIEPDSFWTNSRLLVEVQPKFVLSYSVPHSLQTIDQDFHCISTSAELGIVLFSMYVILNHQKTFPMYKYSKPTIREREIKTLKNGEGAPKMPPSKCLQLNNWNYLGRNKVILKQCLRSPTFAGDS